MRLVARRWTRTWVGAGGRALVLSDADPEPVFVEDTAIPA
jgi:hypothetical protein